LKKKIVIIGSGSQFTEFFLQELFKFEEFRGFTLDLVDRKPDRLEQELKLAKALNNAVDWGIDINGHIDRKEALEGATFVYCFIAVNQKEAWAKEFELANKNGVYPLEAYTSGAPGLGMAIRHVPVMLDICADIEKICPDAWLILDNNPLARLLAAIFKFTKTKCIGYCNGHELMEMALEQLLEMDERDPADRAADPVEREFMVPAGNIDITLSGINHLQWLIDIRDTKTGEDLYPEVRKRIRDPEKVPEGYKYSAEVCRLFGYIPSPADNHVADYIWCVEKEIHKDFSLAPYPVEQWFGGRGAEEWGKIAAGVSDAESARSYIKQRRVGWRNLQIVRLMLSGTQKYFPALNMLNKGAIPNLDDDIVVEVPSIIGPDGFKASSVGPLPVSIAPFCALHGKINNIAAEAAATGSKELALEALLLDPYVHNLKRAKALLDDILMYNKKYETRF
jgi:alpha-galactosidase